MNLSTGIIIRTKPKLYFKEKKIVFNGICELSGTLCIWEKILKKLVRTYKHLKLITKAL